MRRGHGRGRRTAARQARQRLLLGAQGQPAVQGQYPQADLEAAQAHFVEGNVKQARIFAKRALVKLPRGSPEWIRAEDIVNYKEEQT